MKNLHSSNTFKASSPSIPSKAFTPALKKVLIITYYWPPGSGAGVQRWLKFAKYLPEYGWDPVILTVDPEFATYPATDKTLEKDIPQSISVHRTRTLDYFRLYRKGKSSVPSAGFATGNEDSLKSRVIRFARGNFFIPDPRIGWNRFAYKKACELIEKEGIEHVITTSPPHSTQLIGLKLRKKYPSIKWIADLRDPWTDIYYYKMFYHTLPARKIDLYLEKKILQSADSIITVGDSLKDLFSTKFPGTREKTVVISNGYDPEDFSEIKPVLPSIFTLSYIGTLSDAYPVEGFAETLAKLNEENMEFRLKFIGSVSSRQKEILEKACGSSAEFIPYVNHDEAVKYMVESTMLLLIIPDHHSNKSILTGKLFEYLASGKPVLCLGPSEGDAAEILRNTGHGNSADYNDLEKIRSILLHYMAHPDPKQAPSEYDRRVLTERLSSVISGIHT